VKFRISLIALSSPNIHWRGLLAPEPVFKNMKILERGDCDVDFFWKGIQNKVSDNLRQKHRQRVDYSIFPVSYFKEKLNSRKHWPFILNETLYLETETTLKRIYFYVHVLGLVNLYYYLHSLAKPIHVIAVICFSKNVTV